MTWLGGTLCRFARGGFLLCACLLLPVAVLVQASESVTLSPHWQSPLRKGSSKLRDVQGVIGIHGMPAADFSSRVDIQLYQGMQYLMPLSNAVRKLQKRVSSKTDVTCPGFPADSFRYYSFDGVYEGRFNKILLVTDIKDHLVAVQLVDETPRATRLRNHTAEWSIYNFIETKSKANPKWLIAHESSKADSTLRVESELLDSKGDCREYSKLILPQPIVDLISLTSDEMRLKDYQSRLPVGSGKPLKTRGVGRDGGSPGGIVADQRTTLAGKVFQFHNKRQNWRFPITLREDGRVIADFELENEWSWEIDEDGHLVFRNKGGEVTTRFDKGEGRNGALYFEGRFLPGIDVNVLEEVPR